jgi:hypothetical protein
MLGIGPNSGNAVIILLLSIESDVICNIICSPGGPIMIALSNIIVPFYAVSVFVCITYTLDCIAAIGTKVA